MLFHDIEISHVQVDILARDPRGCLTIVEVKTQSRLAHMSWRQQSRLMRVACVLGSFEPVQLKLAVFGESRLQLLDVDGLTV